MGECKDCKNWDEYGFCEAIVIDTRWCRVEEDERIKSYYLAERDEDDCRSAILVPADFGCSFFIKS